MRQKVLLLAALAVLAVLGAGYALARAEKSGQVPDSNTAVPEHPWHGCCLSHPVAVARPNGGSAYALVRAEDGNYYVIDMMRATAKKVKGIRGERD